MPPLILGMPFDDSSVSSHHWVSGLPAVPFQYCDDLAVFGTAAEPIACLDIIFHSNAILCILDE